MKEKGNDCHAKQVSTCPQCGKGFLWFRKLRIQPRSLDNRPELVQAIAHEREKGEPTLKPMHQELLEETQAEGLLETLMEAACKLKSEKLQEILASGQPDWDGCDKTSAFPCPNCGMQLQLYVDFRAIAVAPALGLEDQLKAEGLRMNAQRLAVLQECKESGVLAAFTQTVQHQRPAKEIPRNMEQHMLQFLVNTKPRYMPRFIVNYYRGEFPGNLRFWGANGVIMVVCDGMIRAFFPQRTLGNPRHHSAVQVNGTALGRETQNFSVWTRTRFGYVPPGSTIFLDELRKRSLGEFAKGLV